MKAKTKRDKITTSGHTYDSLIEKTTITDISFSDAKTILLPKTGCAITDQILGVAEELKSVIWACNHGYFSDYKVPFFYQLEDNDFVPSMEAAVQKGEDYYDAASGKKVIGRVQFIDFFKKKYPDCERQALYAVEGLWWINLAEAAVLRKNFEQAMLQMGKASHYLKLAIISKLEVSHHVRAEAEKGLRTPKFTEQQKLDALNFIASKKAAGQSQNAAIKLAIKYFGKDGPKRSQLMKWIKEEKENKKVV